MRATLKLGLVLATFAALLLVLQSCVGRQRLVAPLGEVLLPSALMRLPASESDRFVVLTIDDGPSLKTPELLGVLAKHDVRATFFVHTDHIDPMTLPIMDQIVLAGHDIANHLPEDRSYGRDSADALQAAFAEADAIIAPYATYTPYFRPPQGRYDAKKIDPILEAHGYHPPLSASGSKRRYIMASYIPWDAATGKTDTADADLNTRRSAKYTDEMLSALFPGAIVIFHDGMLPGREPRIDATIVSLDRFIVEAQARGYEVVSLSEAVSRVKP